MGYFFAILLTFSIGFALGAVFNSLFWKEDYNCLDCDFYIKSLQQDFNE